MNNFFIKVIVAVFLIFPIASMNVHASDNQWLVGVWELDFDPDGDTKDWLEFTFDGNAYSVDSKQTRQVPGKFTINGNNIDISFNWKGKVIPIALTYDSGKDKLYAFSKKTGNTSIYKKVR